MTDHDLLEKYTHSRDETAFAELVRRHGAMVHGVAMRIARQDADDVAQAAFLLLARRAHKLSHLNDLGGWLYHTARLTALNATRQRARLNKHIQNLGQISMKHEKPTASAQARDLVDTAIAKLSDDHRQVLILRYVESLSLEESASRLGLTSQAVAKRAQRGLEKLRDYLNRHGLECAPDSLAGLLQLPTMRISESQIAALTKAGQGAASKLAGSLAVTTKTTATAVGIKVAVTAIVAVGLIATTIAITHNNSGNVATTPSSNPATPPTAPPASPITITAPATTPALTADGAGQFATLFLTALRDRDVSHLAGLIEGDSSSQKIAQARSYIAQFRDGPYANSPQRLVQITGGLNQLNSERNLISVVVQCQSPTVADLRSLQLKLVAGQGRWMVDSVNYGLIPALESASKTTIATLPAGTGAAQFASSCFAPPIQVTCGWDGTKVTVPPALVVPSWFEQTNALKQWRRVSDVRTFQFAGTDGFTCEIFVAGGMQDASGHVSPLIDEVRLYRKDGTQAAVSQFQSPDTAPMAWVAVDPTGTRLTFRAQRNVNNTEMQFFEPDGSYRRWSVNQDGIAEREILYDPLGNYVRQVHSAPSKPKPKPATAPAAIHHPQSPG